MRTTPTLVAASGSLYYALFRNGAPDYFDSLTIGETSTNTTTLSNSTEISGTAGQAGMMITQNASASILFSAEL
jgi:hypothetical protein